MHHEILLLIVPLVPAFIVPLLGKRGPAAQWLGFAAYVAGALYAASLLPAVLVEPRTVVVGNWLAPFGISLWLSPLSLGAVLAVYAVAALASASALGGTSGDQPRSVLLHALFVTGSIGMVMTTDVFNAFVFLEVASIAAFALVAFGAQQQPGATAGDQVPNVSGGGAGVAVSDASRARSDGEAAKPAPTLAARTAATSGALRYLVVAQVASLLMLVGIGLLYSATGMLTIPLLASFTAMAPRFALLTGVLLLLPVLLEAEIFPMNLWVGRAYHGASARFGLSLSGIGATAGVVLLARFLLALMGEASTFAAAVPSLRAFVLLLAVASLVLGELAALQEADLKKVLAYSTVGQVGVVAVGLAIGSAESVRWALFLVLAHAVAKSLLFLLAGEFSAWAGSSRWDAMRGLGRARPLTAGLFALAALSIMGMPLFAGFWGKLGIVRASIEAGGLAVVGTVAVLVASVVEGVYFMRITHRLFEADGPPKTPSRLRLGVLIPALALAAVVLLLGLYPRLVDPIMTNAAEELSDPVAQYGRLFRASGGIR